MELYLLEPEVGGGHGEKTIYVEKNNVSFLNYEFYGWLGDELLETTPCFIITENLEQSLSQRFKSHYHTEDCLITKSEEFQELYPNKELPDFKRFIPLGKIIVINQGYKDWSGHHFCLSQRNELVVTEDALEVLKQHSLNYCDIDKLVLDTLD